MKYEAVIGLEIHAELKTRTKMFCASLNDPDERHPNVNICPVCMGHPGTLPVANREAIRHVMRVGLALGGQIPEFSQFDRKNYFYPDLPKGYQISQYEHPFVRGGAMALSSGRTIRIRRIHLEEDTARLIHDASGASLVDFNRAGVPLMELVTEPDFRSGDEIKEFGAELQKILRYLGASDANMEKGEMRVEVNLSLRPAGTEAFGTKVEVKNINSFKFAADAAEHEIGRQAGLLERGEKIAQETRGWNETRGETFSQRKKEEAHDYRYFPEPDLPPLAIRRDEVEELRRHLPELPRAKAERFAAEYGLEREIAALVADEKALAEYFESAVSELLQHDKETPERPKRNLPRAAAALMTGELTRIMKDESASVADLRVTPENFAELVLLAAEEKISNVAAKEVLAAMASSGEDPSDIIEARGLWQLSGAADIEAIARHIVEENPKAAADFRAGKASALQFLVGMVMKDSRGAANPKVAGEILKKVLNSNA